MYFLRLAAAAIDTLAGAAAGLLLANTRVGYFFAGRAAVMLRIDSPESVWKGPIPMIMGIMGPFVYTLPFTILLIFLIEAAGGASPGKKILGIKVISSGGGRPFPKQLWYRTMIKTCLLWGLLISLLLGDWRLALCSVILGAAVVLSMLLSLSGLTRPLHDILSGTRVDAVRAPVR